MTAYRQASYAAGNNGDTIAGIGTRLVAAVIDLALFLAAFFGTGIVAIFAAAALNGNIVWVWPVQLFILFLAGVYNVGVLQGLRGASVGKRVVHIEIVDDVDGRHIGLTRGLLRLAIHVVDCLALVGLFVAMLDPVAHKTIADRVCKTVVVNV